MKIKCKCGKLATWIYIPAEHNWACCDDCVPKGCTCNEYNVELDFGDGEIVKYYPKGKENFDWEWIEKDISWRELDGEGKQLPCCEWLYDEKGWNDED